MRYLSHGGALFFLAGICLFLVFFSFPRALREILPRDSCPEVLLPDMPLGAGSSNLAAFKACTGPEGIESYLSFSRLWDSLFPISYSLLFAGLAGRFLKHTRQIFAYRAALLLSFGTGILDLVENYFLRRALTHHAVANDPTPLVFNILKWCFAAMGLLFLLGILMVHRIKRYFTTRSEPKEKPTINP